MYDSGACSINACQLHSSALPLSTADGALQVFAFTAPYSLQQPEAGAPGSWYSRQAAYDFTRKHGLAVRAVGESCWLLMPVRPSPAVKCIPAQVLTKLVVRCQAALTALLSPAPSTKMKRN